MDFIHTFNEKTIDSSEGEHCELKRMPFSLVRFALRYKPLHQSPKNGAMVEV